MGVEKSISCIEIENFRKNMNEKCHTQPTGSTLRNSRFPNFVEGTHLESWQAGSPQANILNHSLISASVCSAGTPKSTFLSYLGSHSSLLYAMHIISELQWEAILVLVFYFFLRNETTFNAIKLKKRELERIIIINYKIYKCENLTVLSCNCGTRKFSFFLSMDLEL